MIKFELMPHQSDLLYRSQFEQDLFIAWEMGTGKSCATIQVLREKYCNADKLLRTVIFAPLITLKNWKKEFEMFSNVYPGAIHTLDVASKRVAKLASLGEGPGIIVINYDALSNYKVFEALKAWGPEIVVCDESHYLKNYKSKRAKAVAIIADQARHRYMLTGTPILNNALDLFMQFRIMDGYRDKGSTFGHNFFVFRSRFFEDENASWSSKPGHFPKWVPRASTYNELSDIMESKISRVLKKDVLKSLPPLVVETINVTMGPEQLKAYMEMKRDFLTWVKDALKENSKAVVAKLAITKSLRLQQIVSGAVNTEEDGYHIFENNPRIEALRALLEDLTPEHKVIVWCCFKANYEAIAKLCEDMGLGYTEIHGGIKTKDKYANQDTFNNDPGCRVLIGNPGAGGVGINLVSSSYSIYYSRGPKLGDDLQSEARNHRKGSEIHDKITRINMVCPGSIDELIADSLEGKLNISEAILDKGKI